MILRPRADPGNRFPPGEPRSRRGPARRRCRLYRACRPWGREPLVHKIAPGLGARALAGPLIPGRRSHGRPVVARSTPLVAAALVPGVLGAGPAPRPPPG